MAQRVFSMVPGIAALCWAAGFGQNPAVTPILGAQKFYVMTFDLKKDGTAPDVPRVRQMLIDHPQSVNNYIKSASYGLAWIEADFDTARTAGPALSSPAFPGCFFREVEMFDLIPLSLDMRAYRHILAFIHAPPKAECPGGVNSKVSFEVDGVRHHMTISQVRDTLNGTQLDPENVGHEALGGFTRTATIHEIIHGFGVRTHSGAYLCGEHAPLQLDRSKCHLVDYGDPYDVMANGVEATHLQALYREQLGWLPPANISEVAATGEFRLLPIDLTQTGVQSLKVRLPKKIPMVSLNPSDTDSADFLAIEYRTLTGFDIRPENPHYGVRSQYGQGAFIRAISCPRPDSCHSRILDMHPVPPDIFINGTQFTDAPMRPGESFQVPGNPIVIRAGTLDPGKSLMVTVEFTQTRLAGHRRDAVRHLALMRSGRILGRFEATPDQRALDLAAPDGRRFRLALDASGADASGLAPGIYFSTLLAKGKVLLP